MLKHIKYIIILVIIMLPITVHANEQQSTPQQLKNRLSTLFKKFPCTKKQAALIGTGLVSIGVIALIIYKLKPKKQLTEKEKQDIQQEYHRKWNRIHSGINAKATDQDREERTIFVKAAMKLIRKKYPKEFEEQIYLPTVNEFIGNMDRSTAESGFKELIDTEIQQELIKVAEKATKTRNRGKKLSKQPATL